jgi:hypothetical protein
MCELIQEKKPTEENSSTPYKEGLYFNMPEAEYFKIPYFSRSGADKLLFSVEQFWEDSAMNPNCKPQKTTPAMELGTAIHSMLLEPIKFKSLYVQPPTPSDYHGKEILETSKDIKAFLTLVGENITGKKEDLIERALGYLNPKTHIIWDEVINDFNYDVEKTGKRILSSGDVEILEGIKTSLKRKKRIPTILENSMSEVVIIWKDEETGIMCKCMIDAVRPEAIGEVKSFSVQDYNLPLERTMLNDIRYRKYNHQFYVYSQALKTIIKKINAGKAKVFGEVDNAWLKEFLKNSNKQFFIMFFRTQAPYQCKTYELEKSCVPDATSNAYFEQGELLWRTAITKLQACYERFGTSRWIDEDEVTILADEHIPNIIYQTVDI